MSNSIITVPTENAGQRLDVFLSTRLSGFSRSKIQRLIEENGVLVNGKPVKKNARCACGDAIEIQESATKSMTRPMLDAQNIPLEILYEDESFLAVNKPAGMVVHPGNGNPDQTLVNALLHHCVSLSKGSASDRPGIVHRLDKDTSGVLLAVKSDAMHNALATMFANRKVEKNYVGICFGNMPDLHGAIDLPLGRNRREPVKRSVRNDGKNAYTEFWLLSHVHGISVMRFKPHTGRTHQIRVHCSSRGFPIIGDQLYGGGREQIEKISVLDRPFAYKAFKCFQRHALHAFSLSFAHPITNTIMRLQAPFPPDFEKAFQTLGLPTARIEEMVTAQNTVRSLISY